MTSISTKVHQKTKKYWKLVLQATFVVRHQNEEERKLQLALKLGKWTDKTMKLKWITFLSHEEDRFYKRVGLRWQVYATRGRKNT